MKKNIGKTDRITRVIEALFFLALFIFNVAHGIFGIICILIAVILLATSLMSWCPLYVPLRINTIKKEKKLV